MLLSFCCKSTFSWEALREPLGVSAVVVDHVSPLHPPKPRLARLVELLGQPRPRFGRPDGATRGFASRPHTRRLGVEVAIGCGEWSFAPVRLDEPSSRRPIVGVPEA